MSEEETTGCYLVYESDSSGKLIQHYSKIALPEAIGFWQPGEGKKIQGFKFKQNLGKSELIRNLTGGVEGRKNFYSGWCQFIKSAKLMKGTITKYAVPEGVQALEVDIYMYYKEGDKIVMIEDGVAIDVTTMSGVACLPKNHDALGGASKMDEVMFFQKTSDAGSSTKCL
jgi:hypothetical protein